MDHEQALKRAIIEDAAFWDAQMNDVKLRSWVEILRPYPVAKVQAAMNAFRSEPGRTRMPFPADLIARLSPGSGVDPKALAVDIARKIDKAISRHGWTWQDGYWTSKGNYWEAHTADGVVRCDSFKGAVIAELGEIGWHAICSRGGWLALRDSCNTMPEGMFIAQLRDQVEASYQLAKSGVDVTQISLPAPRGQGGLMSVGEIAGILPFKQPERD